MKKIIALILITICSVLFLLGFVQKEESTPQKIDDDIKISLYNIPSNLKDIKKISVREQDIICATSIGLVEKDEKGKVNPLLAKEIKEKDNGIEYEFVFNEDKKWSNGEKITPDDYILFLKELIKTSNEEDIEPLLDIYGAREYRKENTSFEKGVAVIKNDNSLIIRLNKKNESFLEELTKPQYRLRKNIALWENIRSNYDKLLYSGGYSISYMDKSEIKLKGNSEGKKELSFVKDNSSELAMAAFEIGERDVVLNPPKNELNRLQKENKLYTTTSSRGAYIYLNEKDGFPLQSRKQTYSYLNKAMQVYNSTNENYFELAEGSYFRADKEDLSKAQARKVSINTIQEVQMPEVLTVIGIDNNENREVCEFLSKWVKENYNIGIRYTLVNLNEFSNSELRKKYNIVLLQNNLSFNNPGFMENIEDVFGEENKKLLQENNYDFSKVEDKLFNSYTFLPLIFYKDNVAISNKINTIDFDGNGNMKFEELK
ncbi:MAG: ABC transporter substrate-binding protein [Clostridium sp.]